MWRSQDALRADHLGAYGYPRLTSPRFDAFARGAALFEQAIATAPWTPSLASPFTSRSPSFHGSVLHGLATDDASVFEALRDAGQFPQAVPRHEPGRPAACHRSLRR